MAISITGIGELIRKMNLKNGEGEYYFIDNSRYVGKYKDDKMQGNGKLYNYDYSVFTGQFDEGKRNGIGELLKKNGEVFEQEWDKGELVSEKKIDQRVVLKTNEQIKSVDSGNFFVENEANGINFDMIYKETTNFGSINQSSLRNAGPETLSMMEFKEKVDNMEESIREKQINKWGYEEVVKILAAFGLNQFTDTFISNRIKGKALLLLDEEDLKDLGITKLGDKIKMRDLVNKLRKLDKIFKQNKRNYRRGNSIFSRPEETKFFNENIIEEESHSYSSEKSEKYFNSIKSFPDNQNFHSILRVDRKSSNTSIHKKLSQKQISNKNFSLLSDYSYKSDNTKTDLKYKIVKIRSRSLNLDRSFEKFNSNRYISQQRSEKSFGNASNIALHSENGEKDDFSLNYSSSLSSSSNSLSKKEKRFPLKKFDFNDEIGPNLASHLISKDDIEVTKQIGEGAYGQVFKGRYLKTDIAIKIFNKNKLKSEIRKNFIQEAELLCLFRSPFIVLFMGICLNYKDYMIITEYMDQGSLFDFLHLHKKRLSHDMTLNIIESIAHGMNHLHEKKVLHCDLKSSNILVK